jgi:hypothetical protein
MANRKPLLTAEAAAFVKGDTTPPTPAASAQAAAAPEPQEEGRTRMTCDLSKSLHWRLKQAALDRRQSLSDLVRQALAEWLDGCGS